MRAKVMIPLLLTAGAACGAVAVDGATAHASTTTASRQYVACTTPANECAGGRGMQTRPTQMGLSADGSLYVTGIKWHGWGTAKATGTGTAHADNCTPNCAQGTFTKHPATIVFTDPKPWHGKLAYAHVAESVPAIGWHYTFTHGLVP
jgi:hypothetical protein